MFTVGTKVIRKSDGLRGTVVEVNEREVIVKYEATNRTEQTAWGAWTDSEGITGVHPRQSVDRLIESVTA